MNQKKMTTLLMTALCTIPLVAAHDVAFAAPSEQEILSQRQQNGYDDTGVQLNRTQRYLEQQRILEKIAEGRQEKGLEDNREQGEETEEWLRFVLKEVKTPQSRVLKAEELAKITEPYVGKEITVKELAKLVDSINACYKEKGYITCRAFLKPQTIHDGVVEISLLEGKTGEVTLDGVKTTRASYIRNRMRLKEEEIGNLYELNHDILRFNATNDTRLHLELKAGKEAGTTDYVLHVYEPQHMVFGLFADNAGSKTSGANRVGVYWLDRSLTGSRDSLFMNVQRSEGVKAGSLSYTTPISRKGTKLGVSYNGNSVRITNGDFERLRVRGHASSYQLSLIQPIRTSEKIKSEWGIELGEQHSVTQFMNTPWVDDKLKQAQLYVDRINYGKSAVFYQKHGYQFVKFDGLVGKRDGSYGKYLLNTLYQKGLTKGQSFTLRVDGQMSFKDYLPSTSMYYIGGSYSVRGYKESLLGGDSGFSFSAEYSLPLAKRNIMGYTFFDGGSVFGKSAFDDHTLMAAGLGVKANLGRKMMANLSMGVPLIRRLNSEKQDSVRIHFNLNGQF